MKTILINKKMKNKLIIGLTGIAILSLLFVGCSKEPKAEVDAANAAIEKATNAGANIYLAEEYAGLKSSMDIIMQKIEEQKSKSGSDYAGIKEELLALTNLAQELEQKVAPRKEELHNEIQTAMTEVKKLIEENGKLLSSISGKTKEANEFNTISNEQNALKGLFNESNALLKSGDYVATFSKVKTAKEKAALINKNLQELTSKDKTGTKTKKTS